MTCTQDFEKRVSAQDSQKSKERIWDHPSQSLVEDLGRGLENTFLYYYNVLLCIIINIIYYLLYI